MVNYILDLYGFYTCGIFWSYDLSIYDWLPFPLLILVANYSLLSAGNHVVCLGWWEWQQSHRYLWRCWDLISGHVGRMLPLSGTPVANEGLVQDHLQENERQPPGVPTKTRVSCPNRYLWLTTAQWCVGCRGAFQEPWWDLEVQVDQNGLPIWYSSI